MKYILKTKKNLYLTNDLGDSYSIKEAKIFKSINKADKYRITFPEFEVVNITNYRIYLILIPIFIILFVALGVIR